MHSSVIYTTDEGNECGGFLKVRLCLFIYGGYSKVPRISTITTLKFSQSILIFKILSRKRAIYRELKKQRRRRCVYVSKASSSLFVDYINRKKERMAERIQESMEGVTKGYIGDLV